MPTDEGVVLVRNQNRAELRLPAGASHYDPAAESGVPNCDLERPPEVLGKLHFENSAYRSSSNSNTLACVGHCTAYFHDAMIAYSDFDASDTDCWHSSLPLGYKPLRPKPSPC